MQYSYKDLYPACQLESIKGHINNTLRLAATGKHAFTYIYLCLGVEDG